MNEFYIGTLKVLGRTDRAFNLGSPIEGLEFPSLRVSSYDKPGENGGNVSNAFYGMRPITLPGIVQGNTCEEYEANRQSLALACATNKDISGFPTLTRFSFITNTNDSYYFYAQVKSLQFARGGMIKSSKFLLNIIAPDPVIYSTTSKSSGAILRQSGTGFQWPFDWPILWGSSTGGTATLVNNGTSNVFPILTITGAATNPYIVNTTLDKFLQLNYSLTTSDVLVINMKEKTILLNGSTNLLSSKISGSNWWWLQPGNNIINYSTGTSSDAGSLVLTWNDGFLGV